MAGATSANEGGTRVVFPFDAALSLEFAQILCYERNGQQKKHGGASFHIHHPPEQLHALWTHAGFHRVEADTLLELWSKECFFWCVSYPTAWTWSVLLLAGAEAQASTLA